MQYSAYTGRHLSTRRRWMAMPSRSWTAKTDWRERFRSRKPWTVRSRSSWRRARLKYWCRNGRRHRPQIARLGSRDRVFTAGANTTTWFGRTIDCSIGHRPGEHHHQERPSGSERSFAAASIPLQSGHGCGASCRFLTMDRLCPPHRALNAGGYQWRLVGGDGLRKNEALHQIAIEFAEHVHLGR